MLMMTRRAGQKIVIGDGITIEIVEVAGNTVRLGVDAPRSVPVYREEIWTAVRAENEAAATAATTATELPYSAVSPSAIRSAASLAASTRPRTSASLCRQRPRT
jgi:carbon storage regulator